ncbi:MAG: family protein phosphatase [Frankiales bacterium]|jgi:protein phosphatase|nr:family protein phosphatase [Frankiales bacterium]
MTGLRFAARSDVGLLRDGNEDSLYAGPRLLAVADGMGGAAAGEVASAVAIAALAPLDADAPGADLLAALSTAAYDANDHLRALIAQDPSLAGMGTTLTAMLIAGTRVGLLHIGDSRAYLLRDGELTQITHDHTLVQSFVDEGRITLEQASSHPQRALILRALKGDDELELDLSVRDTKPGDRYLLCSDGLSGVVSDQTLREALQLPDPQAAVDRMVELALRGGGPDNITCIVAEVLEETGSGGKDVVVAGAAAEHIAESVPRPDTPAARASMMTVSKKSPTAVRAYGFAHAAPRNRHPVRLAMLLLVLVAIVVGAVIGGRAYLHRQYYVGVHNNQVTVFRGVPDSFAGVNLSSVKENTGIPVAGLLPFWRDKVQDNITAGSLGGAEQIVNELRANQLPPCAAGTAAAPSAATPSTATTPTPTATCTAGAT